MDAFDFEQPKSYYNRPRTPAPWFWVAATICAGILSVCILSILAARYAPRTPRSELDSPARVLAKLSAAGISDADLAKLKVFAHDSPSAARVSNANADPAICCDWGRWSFVGPPDVIAKVRAASAGEEPPY